MISHPQTLFSITITEKQNQTKLNQCFSTPGIFECKHNIIFVQKKHTLQLHISRQFMRDIFFIQSKYLPTKQSKEEKNVRKEKAWHF